MYEWWYTVQYYSILKTDCESHAMLTSVSIIRMINNKKG